MPVDALQICHLVISRLVVDNDCHQRFEILQRKNQLHHRAGRACCRRVRDQSFDRRTPIAKLLLDFAAGALCRWGGSPRARAFARCYQRPRVRSGSWESSTTGSVVEVTVDGRIVIDFEVALNKGQILGSG